MRSYERDVAGYEADAAKKRKQQSGPSIGDAVVLAGVIVRFDPISGDALIRVADETIWVPRWRIGA